MNQQSKDKQSNISKVLASIKSFEEFDRFKAEVEALEQIAKEVLRRHYLPEASLRLFSEGTNIVFEYDDKRVIKIFPPMHLDQYQSELLILNHLQSKISIPTPVVEFNGSILNWPYIIMTKLEGTLLEFLWQDMDHSNKMIIMQELGKLIHEIHSLATQGLESIDCHWEQFITMQISHCAQHQRLKGFPECLLGEIPAYLESISSSLLTIQKPVILTGEYTPMNLLVKNIKGIWHISGLIDFGDCMLGAPEYDLLGPGAFLIQGDKTLLKAFLLAYGYNDNMLTEALSHHLTSLMLLHKYSNLNVQLRIKDWAENVHHLKELENLVWGIDIV